MKELNTEVLRHWLSSGKKVHVVDIRPAAERMEWSIPGSIHLDAYEAIKNGDQQPIEKLQLDPSIPVVTVCGSGKTSIIAAQLFKGMGYDVYNLEGGMKSWNLAWNTASCSFAKFEVVQFRRTGKGCLSYLIVSAGEALVLDASLPIEVYRKFLDEHRWSLKYAIDSHIHADHLSRTKALAEAYGLIPSMPANDQLTFDFHALEDGTFLSLGNVQVHAKHTPGHTLESTCYLVGEQALFTGDTLFTSGVGRPDLKSSPKEASHRAHLLYQSLHQLIEMESTMTVFPGHTGLPVPFDSKMVATSIGQVTRDMFLLQLTEDVFVESLLDRLPVPPNRYHEIVARNIAGDISLNDAVDLESGANRCAIS